MSIMYIIISVRAFKDGFNKKTSIIMFFDYSS